MAITSPLPPSAFPVTLSQFQRFSFSPAVVDVTFDGSDGHVYHCFYVGDQWYGYEDLTELK